jgi:hypothetical protein
MASSIVDGFTKIKQSKEMFQDFLRAVKGGIGERIIKGYIAKIDWILMDFKTQIHFPPEIRESIRQELDHSDSYQTDAIYEKILLLTPKNKELIETVMDSMIDGEEIQFTELKK